MRDLLVLLRAVRRRFRGAFGARVAMVVAAAALTGASAGVLPAVVGIAMTRVIGASAPLRGGFGVGPIGAAGLFARIVAGAPVGVVLAATLGATVITVIIAVASSRLGSDLAGDVTAALRIDLARAVLHASPRAVDVAGAAINAAPPRAPAAAASEPAARTAAVADATPAPSLRGVETVKLAIAREAGLIAELAVAVATGLPQAATTLGVLAYELVVGDTWIVLVGGGALFVASRLATDRASRRVGLAMQGMQRADAEVYATLGELLSGTEELRLLGARGQAVAEFATAAHCAAAARRRFTAALAASSQIRSVLSAMAPLLILAALLASGRAHDAGDVAKLLLWVPLLMGRLEALDALRTGVVERRAMLRATTSLIELPEHPPAVADPARATDVTRGEIVFDGVRWTPPGAAQPVLDGVTLAIPAGATVGLCGASGCGKSSLLRLLLGLDAPSSGTIRVDGVDVERLSAEELPLVFAVLGQASRLFERSVADNLALGAKPPADDAALRAALRAVQLDELAGLREAPAARDRTTVVKASPPNFSGGEQRRLMLARMLVRSSRVFVLDEPEAGLPSATAEQLLRAVKVIAAGRTCVVATHAPHLLDSAFNVVLDRGRVVAQGSHEALVATSPEYRDLLAGRLRGGGGEPQS